MNHSLWKTLALMVAVCPVFVGCSGNVIHGTLDVYEPQAIRTAFFDTQLDVQNGLVPTVYLSDHAWSCEEFGAFLSSTDSPPTETPFAFMLMLFGQVRDSSLVAPVSTGDYQMMDPSMPIPAEGTAVVAFAALTDDGDADYTNNQRFYGTSGTASLSLLDLTRHMEGTLELQASELLSDNSYGPSNTLTGNFDVSYCDLSDASGDMRGSSSPSVFQQLREDALNALNLGR